VATDDSVAWSVCMSVCMSVTLVHPAKAVERNEVPFSRDIDVIPGNIGLVRGPDPPQKEQIWPIWGSEPAVRRDAASRRITLSLVSFSSLL